MRKIGIVTLNGYYNYGNRLQNYALQEVLKSMGFEVQTILIENTSAKKGVKDKIRQIMKNPKLIFKKINNELFMKKKLLIREENFKRFSNQYIYETDYKISENNLPSEKINDFDYFVTGSDQVWNPFFTKGSPLYFLTFAPKEKRLAYAPSFAIRSIPEKYKKNYSDWISQISSLSIREQEGAEIIKELTGRNAEVVADPTLLLTKKEWLKVATPPKSKPTKSYLLTYYLGDILPETKRLISYCEKELDLEIVNLASTKELQHYLTDPAEFLDLINSASLFITDSFHAVVFSILFETPFIVTDRAGSLPSMNSRITTLLSIFNLEHRHINLIDKEEMLEVDFSHINSILEEQRTKSLLYLENALSINKAN